MFKESLKGYSKEDLIRIIIAEEKEMGELRRINRELSIKLEEKDIASKVDHMTGLLNRRGMKTKINEHGEVPYSVVMGDIDNFKGVNDTYGHMVGDEAIALVSEIISKEIRSSDAYGCRFGGDEIMFLLVGCDEEDAISKCERIQALILEKSNNKLKFPITMSFGISHRNPELKYESAKKMADQALYYSKLNGKNRITVYNEEVRKYMLENTKHGGAELGNKGNTK